MKKNKNADNNQINVIIKTSGEILPLPLPATGVTYSWEELKGFVGGLPESVRVHREVEIIVDGDGHPKGLPINPVATMIYHSYLAALGHSSDHPLAGDVLIVEARFLE